MSMIWRRGWHTAFAGELQGIRTQMLRSWDKLAKAIAADLNLGSNEAVVAIEIKPEGLYFVIGPTDTKPI